MLIDGEELVVVNQIKAIIEYQMANKDIKNMKIDQNS
jgi:hypothetical protein